MLHRWSHTDGRSIPAAFKSRNIVHRVEVDPLAWLIKPACVLEIDRTSEIDIKDALTGLCTDEETICRSRADADEMRDRGREG